MRLLIEIKNKMETDKCEKLNNYKSWDTDYELSVKSCNMNESCEININSSVNNTSSSKQNRQDSDRHECSTTTIESINEIQLAVEFDHLQISPVSYRNWNTESDCAMDLTNSSNCDVKVRTSMYLEQNEINELNGITLPGPIEELTAEYSEDYLDNLDQSSEWSQLSTVGSIEENQSTEQFCEEYLEDVEQTSEWSEDTISPIESIEEIQWTEQFWGANPEDLEQTRKWSEDDVTLIEDIQTAERDDYLENLEQVGGEEAISPIVSNEEIKTAEWNKNVISSTSIHPTPLSSEGRSRTTFDELDPNFDWSTKEMACRRRLFH